MINCFSDTSELRHSISRGPVCKITVNSEIFISRIALKHIFVVLKIRDKGMIYLSVNDRVILPIREDFIFTKLPNLH